MLGVNSTAKREENDFYATDPYAIRCSINLMKELGLSKNIWECSCGNGSLSKELERLGYNVKSTDLIERGYGTGGVNFLCETNKFNGDILTNPPFKLADKFVEKGLELLGEGQKLWLFLKVQFLETKARKILFKKYPPKYILVNSERICCAMNGEFDKYFNYNVKKEKYGGGTQMYCWYVWEKGYMGDTILKII